MSGRLGHISGDRRVGHVPKNGLRVTNYAYGLGGCTFWLDASALVNSGTPADLDPVSSWADKITGIPFLQTTAGNRPRIRTANASYNNNPTIEFFDNVRRLTSNTRFQLGSTVVFVANYNTIQTANLLIGSNVNATSSIGLGGSFAGLNGVYVNLASTGSFVMQGTTDSSSVKIVVITQNMIFVNGVQEATGSFQYDDTVNQIGQRGTESGIALVGNVAEILFFNYNFTALECLRMSTYLNSKYAIY
jgi:hypothetical protein